MTRKKVDQWKEDMDPCSAYKTTSRVRKGGGEKRRGRVAREIEAEAVVGECRRSTLLLLQSVRLCEQEASSTLGCKSRRKLARGIAPHPTPSQTLCPQRYSVPVSNWCCCRRDNVLCRAPPWQQRTVRPSRRARPAPSSQSQTQASPHRCAAGAGCTGLYNTKRISVVLGIKTLVVPE